MKPMLRLVVLAILAVSFVLPQLAWSQVYFVCRKPIPPRTVTFARIILRPPPRRTPRPGAAREAWTRPIISPAWVRPSRGRLGTAPALRSEEHRRFPGSADIREKLTS